jgi:hypothetical protein
VFWTQRQDIGPAARRGHGLAFDPGGRRTLLYGGMSASLFADTWEWDGTNWTQLQDVGPVARADHALAFDGARGRLVLFGGLAAAGVLADTWEWDGSDWTQTEDTGPAARSGHAMCFDSVRNKTVLFAGHGRPADETALFADTWEWDGVDWTQVQDSGPAARSGHAMCFDQAHGRAVLFGGGTASDTWQWDGSLWTHVADTGPAPCGQTSLVSTGDGCFLFGGVSPASDPALLYGLTWKLDGAVWTEVQDIGPSARWGHSMSFDGGRNSVVLFGGNNAQPGDQSGLLADTWELPVHPAAAPGGGGGGGPGQPGAIHLTSLTVAPSTVNRGADVVVTASLNGPTPGAQVVLITVNGGQLANGILVAAGMLQGQLSLSTDDPLFVMGLNTLTGSLGNTAQSASVQIII